LARTDLEELGRKDVVIQYHPSMARNLNAIAA